MEGRGGLLEASVRVTSGQDESMTTAAVDERRLLLFTRGRFLGAPAPVGWFPIIVFLLGLDKGKIGANEKKGKTMRGRLRDKHAR